MRYKSGKHRRGMPTSTSMSPPPPPPPPATTPKEVFTKVMEELKQVWQSKNPNQVLDKVLSSTINYVLATFPGTRDKRDKWDISPHHVDIQLTVLRNIFVAKKILGIPNLIRQVTVSCQEPNDGYVYEGYYRFDKWKKMFSEFKDVKFVVEKFPQDASLSYSQWTKVMLKYPEYDYTILNEDDISISPTNVNFDVEMVRLYVYNFPSGKGYLCSRTDMCENYHHASVSTGIVSTKSVTEIPYVVSELTITERAGPQIVFSLLFTYHGMEIKDMSKEYKVIFWEEWKSRLHDMSRGKTLKEMFIPNQCIYGTSYYPRVVFKMKKAKVITEEKNEQTRLCSQPE